MKRVAKAGIIFRLVSLCCCVAVFVGCSACAPKRPQYPYCRIAGEITNNEGNEKRYYYRLTGEEYHQAKAICNSLRILMEHGEHDLLDPKITIAPDVTIAIMQSEDQSSLVELFCGMEPAFLCYNGEVLDVSAPQMEKVLLFLESLHKKYGESNYGG